MIVRLCSFSTQILLVNLDLMYQTIKRIEHGLLKYGREELGREPAWHNCLI